MKIKALVLLGLFSLNTFAAVEIPEEAEIVLEDEALDTQVVKIRDVRKLITEIGAENTCMDEYLKRRKQLIVKLSLSPVTLVAGTYIGTMGAGLLGIGVASIAGADALAGVVLGMVGGFYGTSVGIIADSRSAALQLVDIDRIVKALAEQHLNQPAQKSAKLYAKYAKKSESPLDEQSFYGKILELDNSGKLCDGSMVKKPIWASGRKLKHKLARTKQLALSI